MTATVLLVTLIVTTLTVVGHASRTRPRAAQVPLSAATQTHRQVYFLSSQGQPPKEAQALQANVLHGFDLAVDFNSEPTAAQGIEQILQESGTGSVTVDLTAQLEGDMRTLEAAGALEDLTPLVTRLEQTRQLPTLPVAPRQPIYSIPWLQATYMMAVNKQALRYLPPGATLNNLTYDQLVDWGEALRNVTGRNMIGLPMARGTGGGSGLFSRFLEGYAYPSFTGTELTGFASPESVAMWASLRRLWAVTDPRSTDYSEMSDPLESGEVWIAWDHQARLADALARMGGQLLAAPAPSGPMGLGYMTVTVALAIPKGAPDRAGAEALIDWLTRPQQQAAASAALGFLPVVGGAFGSRQVPAYLRSEGAVADLYRRNDRGIAVMPPVGVGLQGDQVTLVYQDTFTRILLHGEDIQSVLTDEAGRLQKLVTMAGAPCWPPDPPSAGPCRIRGAPGP